MVMRRLQKKEERLKEECEVTKFSEPKLKLGKNEKLELTHYVNGIPVWCITSKMVVDSSHNNGYRREYYRLDYKDGTFVRFKDKFDDPRALYI